MYYKKIEVGDKIIIEFTSNWLGEESVIVNGQIVSRKASITGIDHTFNIIENGTVVRYILTSKLDAFGQAFLDLRRNHQMIGLNIPVKMGGRPDNNRQSNAQSNTGGFEMPALFNALKISGLKKLKEYHIEDAIEDFSKALEKSKSDPEIYFHLACAYSILEKPKEGFDNLKKAVELGLNNNDAILTHEMLSYLRIHPSFEDFLESGYKKYDL